MHSIAICYINVANRTDRRDYIERHLSELGLAGQRIDAVTPADIDASLLERHCGQQAAFALTPTELACAMSHVRCWQTDTWTLVLEDDAVLSRRLPGFLRAFCDDTPPNVDLLQLQAHLLRRTRVLPPSRDIAGIQLRRFRSNAFGGACYLLSPHGARYLLQRSDLLARPIDSTLFDPTHGPSRKLRSMIADPALAVQLVHVAPDTQAARSDLSKERRSMRRPLFLDPVNAIDHLWHLPQGLSRRWIRFADEAALKVGTQSGYAEM